MTLDDAIKHAEEVADSHDRIKQIKAVTLEECKCAEEHRQLAEWLRELRQLKKQEFCVTTRKLSDDELKDFEERIKKERWQLISVKQDPSVIIPQQPMQVELEADGYSDGELVYDWGKCPNCGWGFENGDKDWEEPYCCHCGQKLHWFD